MGNTENNDEHEISNKDIYELLKTVMEKNSELQKQSENIKEEIKQEIRNTNIQLINEVKDLKRENKELKEEYQQLKNRLLANERKSKKYNLIIYGKAEEENLNLEIETLLKLIVEILELDCNFNDIRDLYRIGNRVDGKNRPLAIELINYQLKVEILANAKKLKGTGLYIAKDYIPEDYIKRKVLYEHLKKARENRHEAIIKNNVLIVNGDKFTFEELNNKKEQQPEQQIEHGNNPQGSPLVTATVQTKKNHEYFTTSSTENKKRKQSTESENPVKRSTRTRNTEPKLYTK